MRVTKLMFAMDVRKPTSVLALRHVSQHSPCKGEYWVHTRIRVKFFIAQLACDSWVFALQYQTQKGQKGKCH